MSESFVTPWTVAYQAPLSMGFPGKQYWSGLLFPFPGDLPDPGIKPMSPAKAGRFYITEPPGKPNTNFRFYKKLPKCPSTDWMNGVQQRKIMYYHCRQHHEECILYEVYMFI